MTLKERLNRTRAYLNLWVAGKLPKRLKYWAVIDEISKITTSVAREQDPMGLTVQYILENMDHG